MDCFLYDRDLLYERVDHSYNKFKESEVKKENKFSRSRNFDFTCIHFNIYECLKWLEKPLWLINTKFGDIIDMFNKYRGRSPKVVIKNGILDSFAKFRRKHLCQSLLLKKPQATGRLR